MAKRTFPFNRPSGPPAPIVLYEEPAEDVLVLGLMLDDLQLADEMLRRLAFDRDDYSGTIRVARGAAHRFITRCDRLLDGQEATPADTRERQRDRGIPRKGTRAAPPQPAGDSFPDRILAALLKKPMSSAELAEALRLEPKHVYAPCSLLKKKGSILSKDDDGIRRWFVKA